MGQIGSEVGLRVRPTRVSFQKKILSNSVLWQQKGGYDLSRFCPGGGYLASSHGGGQNEQVLKFYVSVMDEVSTQLQFFIIDQHRSFNPFELQKTRFLNTGKTVSSLRITV